MIYDADTTIVTCPRNVRIRTKTQKNDCDNKTASFLSWKVEDRKILISAMKISSEGHVTVVISFLKTISLEKDFITRPEKDCQRFEK